jgi:hypothetical protein
MDRLASQSLGVGLQEHVVFSPKCRRRTLFGDLRRHVGDVFRLSLLNTPYVLQS